jgi:hypothetical protein
VNTEDQSLELQTLRSMVPPPDMVLEWRTLYRGSAPAVKIFVCKIDVMQRPDEKANFTAKSAADVRRIKKKVFSPSLLLTCDL